MPEAPLTQGDTIQDIEALFDPPHNRAARQRFVSALRKHALVDKAAEMKDAFESAEAPAFKARKGHAPKDLNQVKSAMARNLHYRMYSVMRLHGQEMPWPAVMDDVEENYDAFQDAFATARRLNPAGGTLELDPEFDMPKYMVEQEMHHVPGSFMAEHGPDDLSQGVVGFFGGKIFNGGMPLRRDNPGAVGETVAHFLALKHPNFRPKRILDLGTGIGRNVVPYLDVYPDAEVYGVDVSAPGLRLGHTLWEARGKRVHLSQQNGGMTNFPDDYFDLIVSSFFFHEIPVSLTKKVLRDNFRLLRKGGMVAHMELPPNNAVDPYYAFVLDWDGYNNNERDYCEYRALVPKNLCAEAGFDRDTCFAMLVPNWRSFGNDKFARWASGELPSPPHGNGASWFIFGGTKMR
ncbi:MAG: class I SAM-dependent methyltransferase [Rhodobacteraceae bacterium]|nr:class I SAM-dependent methyltransferase [Paracoccaceae bacterium]